LLGLFHLTWQLSVPEHRPDVSRCQHTCLILGASMVIYKKRENDYKCLFINELERYNTLLFTIFTLLEETPA